MKAQPKVTEDIKEICEIVIENEPLHVYKFTEFKTTDCDYCPTKCENPRCVKINITTIELFSQQKTEKELKNDCYYYCIPNKTFFYKYTPEEIAKTILSNK